VLEKPNVMIKMYLKQKKIFSESMQDESNIGSIEKKLSRLKYDFEPVKKHYKPHPSNTMIKLVERIAAGRHFTLSLNDYIFEKAIVKTEKLIVYDV